MRVGSSILMLLLLGLHTLSHAEGLKLSGLDIEEIEKYFGKPDQKVASASGRETWTYGRSVLLIRDGKVSAWSDAGDLARRMKLSRVRIVDPNSEQERELWKSSWQTQERLKDDVLLEGLIRKSQESRIKKQQGEVREK